MKKIQNIADDGYFVFFFHDDRNPDYADHIGFVGNSGLELFALDIIGKDKNEAQSLYDRKKWEKGTDLPDYYLPVLVQAGTFVGVQMANYGINDWNDYIKYNPWFTGRLHFYLIKDIWSNK